MKDVQKLEKEFEKVPNVQDVPGMTMADISLPTEMIPKDIRKSVYQMEMLTMMLVLFDDTTSSDNSMEALTQLRKIANKQCFISGMTGIVTDIKNIANERTSNLCSNCSTLESGSSGDYIRIICCSVSVPVKYRTS